MKIIVVFAVILIRLIIIKGGVKNQISYFLLKRCKEVYRT